MAGKWQRRVCRLCRQPFAQGQAETGLWCSVACYLAAHRDGRPSRCRVCQTPLSYRQVRMRVRACSPSHGLLGTYAGADVSPDALTVVVLDVLRNASPAYPLTASDLSFWAFGMDKERTRGAVRVAIHRLRRAGYQIDSFRLPLPPPGHETQHGYRLISEVRDAAA